MVKQKVVHLRFKKTDAEDYFFGSIKAIYDCFEEACIGIKYKSLTNALRGRNLYENKHCIIRVGALISKQQKRQNQ
jgi:hypothetical protein